MLLAIDLRKKLSDLQQRIVEPARLAADFVDGHLLAVERLQCRVERPDAGIQRRDAGRLLGLPEEVLEYLRQGDLTAGQARPLLALPSANDQIRMARKATRSKLTAREMESAARRSKPDAWMGPRVNVSAAAVANSSARAVPAVQTCHGRTAPSTATRDRS